MGQVVLLLTCEHGGNEVPAAYRAQFVGAAKVLESHRGYDPGALELARAAARRFEAPLFSSKISRLVVDLNRTSGHPTVFSTYTQALPTEERQILLERLHAPHHRRVEEAVGEALASGAGVLHVAIHSFTPIWNGTPRGIDLGLLYDSRRGAERALATAWKDALAEAYPELRLRRNAPYRGTGDGLTTWLRRRFSGRPYVGFELEVNHGEVDGGRFPGPLRDAGLRTVGILREACTAMARRRLQS